jgi:hypothetical protein
MTVINSQLLISCGKIGVAFVKSELSRQYLAETSQMPVAADSVTDTRSNLI